MRRVDQLLSSLGYCSRKEAQRWCESGRVEWKGARLDDASQRADGAELRVDGEPLEFPHGLLVMLHKPVGVVCTHDSREGARIYDTLPARWELREPKVTSIGRLDKETSGLLLLTDQGALVQRLTSPRHHVSKTYVARLDGDVTPALIASFHAGVELKEGAVLERTAPATLTRLGDSHAEVTVQEGRYHQVRRMFAAHGLQVLSLHRTAMGKLTLDPSLEPGHWRALPLDTVV